MQLGKTMFSGISLLLCASALAPAQVLVSGKITDETGLGVGGARVEVRATGQPSATVASSDAAGHFSLRLQNPGEYSLSVEKLGFFVLRGRTANLQEGENQLSLTLNHLQEFSESIDVTYSPPAIDLQEPAERKELASVEILTVPYPAPQDLRNALPLLNGVVQDNAGRAHVNGGDTNQTNYTLDGFNLADPVDGLLNARMNIESVREMEVQTNRFSAEKGRGSAGTVDIQTKMGDDRLRFGATNFVPSVSTDGGLHFNKWSPRLEVSGPMARGRAWYHNGFDAFYDVDTVPGLPAGQNRTRGLTATNLSRLQVNVTPVHILTATFLVNRVDARDTGLSFLSPMETTMNQRQNFYMASVRDQHYFHSGALVEFGFADSRGVVRAMPQGSELFQISPFGTAGNYFAGFNRHFSRQQWLSNLFLPPIREFGTHQLKFGVDLQRENFLQSVTRHDYEVLRADLSVARRVTFAGNRFQNRRDFENAQYIQDRWTPREGLLIEAGLRTDWDQVVREVLWSPRFSAAWAPKALGGTKLAVGFGVFHDALSLGMLTQHQDQVSYSTFFPRGAAVGRGPVPTAFLVNDRDLRVPRYRTSSLTVERKLPLDLQGKVSYTHRVGSGGFTFVNILDPFGIRPLQGGLYDLRNWRHDRYDALEFTVRRTFGRFEWMAGYTRSSARADAVVSYSLENPIFGPQGAGPFGWDTPTRFLTWGWAPVPVWLLPRRLQFIIRNTDIAYLGELHSGFPFSVVNEEGLMVGCPNCRRYPRYLNLNLHFERRFRALHYLWAWRFGFNNITNSGNPNTVNNNIDSPQYLAYGRGQARAFAVRLRFLGKK